MIKEYSSLKQKNIELHCMLDTEKIVDTNEDKDLMEAMEIMSSENQKLKEENTILNSKSIELEKGFSNLKANLNRLDMLI